MNTKKETAKLGKMKVNELQAKFAEVTGETTRSPNKVFLIRRISEALQAASAKAEKAPEAAVPETEVKAQTEPAATAEVTEQVEPAARAEATAQTEPAGGKLTRLEVPELQARYLEVVGRPTGSTNKPYLIWKIREAQKGRIPLGPRKNAHRDGVTFKVLPLRMESTVVDKLDEAWRARGIKNRMEFFRGALSHYLKHLGAEDAAALFADATAALV
ncbi:MAG: ribbon-helix-helix domain-containing protein [Polyangia bacterium]